MATSPRNGRLALLLLTEQFRLGLFEDPYVDADRAAYLVGNRAFQMRAEEAQRKSIVLLQNHDGFLPLKPVAGALALTLSGSFGFPP